MTICRHHDVVISRCEVSEKKLAGHRIRYRRTNNLAIHLRRHDRMAGIKLLGEQGGSEEAVDTVQHKRNHVDHWLQFVLPVAGLHN